MAVEEAIRSLLSGVTGSLPHWGRGEGASATTGPYLVLNRISATRDYAIDGATGYAEGRFQIDAYGNSYRAAYTAASDVMAILNGYRGTVADTLILGIFINSERDLLAADAGEAQHLFRRSVDVTVHYHE